MKTLLKTAIIVALCAASPAVAGGWNNGGGNNGGDGGNGGQGGAGGHGGEGGQGYGGFGGDGGTGVGAASASAGAAAGANNSYSVNSKYEEAAYAPGVLVGECQIGLSAGIPGAVAGVGIPSKHCRVMQEAELIQYYWGKQAAAQHLVSNNARIRRTIGKQQAAPTRVTTRSRTTTAAAMRGEDR